MGTDLFSEKWGQIYFLKNKSVPIFSLSPFLVVPIFSTAKFEVVAA